MCCVAADAGLLVLTVLFMLGAHGGIHGQYGPYMVRSFMPISWRVIAQGWLHIMPGHKCQVKASTAATKRRAWWSSRLRMAAIKPSSQPP